MSTIVALLGAESTGKSVLTQTLAQRLGCGWVGEYLREWCEREARTPRIDEQQHIADEQRRRIEAAAARHALVIADTTPLMTAVYSEIVFGDRSLYAPALAWQLRHVALSLVTGLDMPWLPDGLQRDGPHVRMPVDRALRGALAGAGIAYGTVYGDGEARVQAVQRAMQHLLGPQDRADAVNDAGRPWRPRCLECLDPACERRSHQAAD